MKRIVVLLSALLALFVFCSCGEVAESSDGVSEVSLPEESKEEKAYAALVSFINEKGIDAPEGPLEGKGSGYQIPSFDRCFAGESAFNTGSSSLPVYVYLGVLEGELYFVADSANGQYRYVFEEGGNALTITAQKKNAFDCEEYAEKGKWINADAVFNKRHETKSAGIAFDKEPRYQMLWTMEEIDELLQSAGAGVSLTDLGYRHVPSVGAAI